MNSRNIRLTAFAIALAIAPMSPSAYALDPAAASMTVEQAVKAATPGQGVFAQVTFVVASLGGQKNLHLNSQADFKDPNNFSVMVKPDVAQELQARFKADPRTFLLGKNITVTGDVTASKGRFANPHIDLKSADQLQVAPSP